jgi:hypothetical protein
VFCRYTKKIKNKSFTNEFGRDIQNCDCHPRYEKHELKGTLNGPILSTHTGLRQSKKGGTQVQGERKNLHVIENVNFYFILYKLLE